jgi:hypothetical protein
MAELLACPFCRQLYPSAETRSCPECGVALVRMDRLPPSHDAELEDLAAGAQPSPDDRTLAWNDFRYGRGGVIAVAACGLAAFFLPWVALTRPEALSLSGFDLARRAGWLWGGAIGWFLLIPLIWTRRTPGRLRGVRGISAVFAAMTLLEVVVLIGLPPKPRAYAVEFSTQFGLYLSGLLSVAGVALALRLGGPPTKPGGRATTAGGLDPPGTTPERPARQGSKAAGRKRVLH